MPAQLVVTPKPKPYESPFGFIIRTAEVNGYQSGVDIMRLAGMSENEARSIRVSSERLAPLYACESSHLQGIDYHDTVGSSRRYLAIHGHRINTRYMDSKRHKLCPQCVADRGFVDAVWDLRYALVCPVHYCALISRCPQCDRGLSIARPGLLRCKCGYELGSDDVGDEHLPDSVLALASFLDSIFHHRELDRDLLQSVGFPVEDMTRLSLVTLLQLIDRIGKQADANSNQTGNDGAMQELATTAGAFEQWPAGFYRYLNRIEKGQESILYRSLGMSRRFEGFYSRVFKGHIAADETQFIKDAFLGYERTSILHDGKGAIERAKGIRSIAGVHEIARMIQVQPSTVRSMIEKGVLRCYRVGNDVKPCRVVDTTGPLPRRTNSGTSLSPRKAARLLGLPVSMLSLLRREGVFTVQYIGSKSGSYHSHDVARFRARIENVLQENSNNQAKGSQGSSTIRLDELIRRPSINPECKVAVIRAILDKKITVHGSNGRDIQSTLLDGQSVDSIIVESELDLSIGLKFNEAAKSLGCDVTVIPWMLESGFLDASSKGRFRRITRQSIDRFSQDYIFCARIARELGKSSRKVIDSCQLHDIPMIWADRSYSESRQPFILIADIPRLRAEFGAPLLVMNAE